MFLQNPTEEPYKRGRVHPNGGGRVGGGVFRGQEVFMLKNVLMENEVEFNRFRMLITGNGRRSERDGGEDGLDFRLREGTGANFRRLVHASAKLKINIVIA